MEQLNLHGIIPACVVTFDQDGHFDEKQYRRYLQWLLPQAATSPTTATRATASI